jgi:hypothetical protein
MNPCRLPLIAASFLLFAGPGWSQQALTVPFEVERVSNPTLAPDSPGNVTLVRISPRYSIEGVSDERRSILTLGGVLERSSNSSLSANRSLPSLDYRLEFGSPTSSWSLQGLLEEASTRTTEFTDFGRVGVDSTQRTASLSALWNREVTATSSLGLGTGYTRVRFDTPLLIGYQETSASALYRMQGGERTRYTIDGQLARLSPVDNTPSSSRFGIIFGYENDLSELLTLTATLGAVRTNGAVRDTGAVGGVTIGYEGDRLASSLEIAREVSPSGSVGGYDRTNALRGALSYPVTPQTTLSLALGHTRTLGLVRATGSSAAIRVRSELSEFWALTFGVEHRNSRPQGLRSASGNVIGLGLVYSHPNL